jgi:hypothetical protein
MFVKWLFSLPGTRPSPTPLSYAPRVCPPASRSRSLQMQVHINTSRAYMTQCKLHKFWACYLLNTTWLNDSAERTRIYLVLCLWKGPPLWSSGQRSWLQNDDVLRFLWGTNLIYVCYVEESRPPLWSSGQSSWPHNGNVLCFLWGTDWIYICYVKESRPPLWSSG